MIIVLLSKPFSPLIIIFRPRCQTLLSPLNLFLLLSNDLVHFLPLTHPPCLLSTSWYSSSRGLQVVLQDAPHLAPLRIVFVYLLLLPRPTLIIHVSGWLLQGTGRQHPPGNLLLYRYLYRLQSYHHIPLVDSPGQEIFGGVGYRLLGVSYPQLVSNVDEIIPPPWLLLLLLLL